MLNFFAIVLIIFIGILLIILKKRSLKKFIDRSNLYSSKFKKDRNNKQLLFNKNSFSYKHEEKKFSILYRNSQRSKMFTLFQGDTEDKLKALTIAEELADKSTLTILRKGLRDISPDVVKFSALLIGKFK